MTATDHDGYMEDYDGHKQFLAVRTNDGQIHDGHKL